jgi:hypothetical protein
MEKTESRQTREKWQQNRDKWPGRLSVLWFVNCQLGKTILDSLFQALFFSPCFHSVEVFALNKFSHQQLLLIRLCQLGAWSSTSFFRFFSKWTPVLKTSISRGMC